MIAPPEMNKDTMLPSERRFLTAAWGALILLASGCAPDTGEDVLAEVGETQVLVSEFMSFRETIPEGMKEGDTPLARERSVLETLIDKKLLIMEAGAARIEDDPWFQRQLEALKNKQLLEMYHRRETLQGIAVTREERDEHFRATGRDRSLRFSGIMLESREQAGEVVARLQAGADFEELAAQRSFHRETGERGGDSGVYMKKDDVRPAIAERIFHLQVGEISEPVPMRFQGRSRWVVFRIDDAIPVRLEEVEQLVDRELLAARTAERRKARSDSLLGVFEPRLRSEQLELLRQAIEDTRGSTALDAQRDLVLAAFRGGEITAGELLDRAEEVRYGRGDLADSTRLVGFLNRFVIPPRLALQAAKSLGMHRDPALEDFVERRKELLMISALRRDRVDRFIAVTAGEAREFYDANPKKFTSPETWVAAEILVHSEDLARSLKSNLEDGADPAALVKEHSTRSETVHHEGEIRLNSYTKAFFPEIHEAASKLDAGEVGGPVRVPNGWSVFKILDRKKELAPYDADARRRAEAYVRIDRARRGYVSLLGELRQRYSVTVDEERFERVLAGESPRAGG